MEKAQALIRWRNLTPNQEILPHFTPLAADAHGSTFGACGIRISGNPEFIDAVLSRLKDLLAAEAGSTRLNLSRQPVKAVSIKSGDSVVDKQWRNADEGAETCYIQIRERTAKTRMRKVRASSNPLPNLEMPPDGEIRPSKQSAQITPTATPTRTESPTDGTETAPNRNGGNGGIVMSHIGSRNGEVIWDDDEETEERTAF